MAAGPLVPFKLFYGEVASGTGDGTVTGLPFTPDFVLAQVSDGRPISWSATSTTLTFTGRDATTATTICYIAGLVSA